MTIPTKAWVTMGVLAAMALVIGANWHFIAVAFQSQPGCVPVSPDMPAAKPGC